MTIRVADRAASSAFYDLALGGPTHADEVLVEWGDFSLVEGEPTRALHVGFEASSRAMVDAWWARLTGAGYRSDGSPGERPQYTSAYYGAFVLDPDGTSVEAVHNPPLRGAQIDHLWLRTRRLGEARRFWSVVAPVLGLELRHDGFDRLQYSGSRCTFAIVPGEEPTTNAHIAFPVAGDEEVAALHRAATSAGFAGDGAVRDADGNSIEAVCHHR